MCICFTTIRLHEFVVHETLPNKKKMKKKWNTQLLNFFLFNMVVGFLKKEDIIMHLLLKNVKYTIYEQTFNQKLQNFKWFKN